MNKENNEEIVKEIIEYANKEIKKSKKKYLMIFLLILLSIVVFSTVLLFAFTFEKGYIMWLFFGITAIITAILNVIWTLRQREAKCFMFISLSFTALTICSFYSLAMQWVLNEQADQLLDVMPTLSKCLWFVTISSVIINSITLFKNRIS